MEVLQKQDVKRFSMKTAEGLFNSLAIDCEFRREEWEQRLSVKLALECGL